MCEDKKGFCCSFAVQRTRDKCDVACTEVRTCQEYYSLQLPTIISLEAMSDVGVCGEVQVVPAPAALPGQDALAPLQPPAPPEPPAPLLQPVTLGAPLALYQGYKPVGMGELQKGGMLASSLVDNARRGPQPTICEHNLPKSKCKTCKANARICKHNKKKELCRECDGSALCIHDLRKKVHQQAPRTGHKNARTLLSMNSFCRRVTAASSAQLWTEGSRRRCTRDCL